MYINNNLITSSLPDLSALTVLAELYISNMNLSALPALPLGSLVRLDINGNRLSGLLELCSPTIKIINMNGNPRVSGLIEPVGGRPCLPSLTSLNAAGCNLTAIDFLRFSPGVTDLDLSDNPVLGSSPFSVARAAAWPMLQALRVQRIGVSMNIADLLATVVNITTLLTLDASHNEMITGDLTVPEFQRVGIYDGSGRITQTFSLIILRLDSTRIATFKGNMEAFFTSVRVLSLRNTTAFQTEVPLNGQRWLHLEQIDLRGSSCVMVTSLPLATVPENSMVVDVKSNSSCPSSIYGGTVSQYIITADPVLYNYSLCSCLGGHYGEPRRTCLECPAAPAGETSVAVDCETTPGRFVAHGGWIFFDRATSKPALLPCPSDSPQSPCLESSLARSVTSLAEWDSIKGTVTACAPGYEGRLCARCREGFFRSGRSCLACGSRSLAWVSPVLSLLVITALGVKTVTGGHTSRSGLIRTLTLHAQLVSLLPDMSLRLSEGAGFFIKAASSGSGGLRLEGLECVSRGWDGFYGPFVQSCLLPIVVLIGGAWVTVLSGFVGKGKSLAPRTRMVTAIFYLWLVLLFNSMQRLLSPLNCTAFGSTESASFLNSALWIRCRGGSYNGLLATSILLGLGYTLGTVGLVLYRLRPSSKGTSSVSLFLRSPYTSEAYFWEAVQLLRRVTLAMASSLTRLYSPIQPVIVSSILILSLLAHTWKKPYIRPLDNIAESISLTLLLSSYMAGLIASNPRFPSSATTLISWLFFALNALFILSMIALTLTRSMQSMKRFSKGNHSKELGVRLSDEQPQEKEMK
jgi:hypothetical protein